LPGLLTKTILVRTIIGILLAVSFGTNSIERPLLSQSYAITQANESANVPSEEEETAIPFIPQYNVTQGKYVNDELGFEITLPDQMTGFITEYYSDDGNKSIGMQIHPEFNSTDPSQCCPTIDLAPAVFMFDDLPNSASSTPIPFTGDLYAAFQGYNMRMTLSELNGTEVLVSTVSYDERNIAQDSDIPAKRVGKFYLMNSGDRFLSYGLLASEKDYAKYIDKLESSAKTISIEDAKPLDLDKIFYQYSTQGLKIERMDGSVLNPQITSSSIVESITANETANALKIHLNQTSDNDFLIMNMRNLLASPHHVVTSGGNQIESMTLKSSDGDEYLVAFYNGTSSGNDIIVLGSAIMPEFEPVALLVVAAAATIIGVFAVRTGRAFLIRG
jgi:hypothetical protein